MFVCLSIYMREGDLDPHMANPVLETAGGLYPIEDLCTHTFVDLQNIIYLKIENNWEKQMYLYCTL